VSVSSLDSGFSDIVVVGGGIARRSLVPRRRARRAHFRDLVREDPNLGMVAVVTHLGPDLAPAWVFDETIHTSVLNLEQAVAV